MSCASLHYHVLCFSVSVLFVLPIFYRQVLKAKYTRGLLWTVKPIIYMTKCININMEMSSTQPLFYSNLYGIQLVKLCFILYLDLNSLLSQYWTYLPPPPTKSQLFLDASFASHHDHSPSLFGITPIFIFIFCYTLYSGLKFKTTYLLMIKITSV